MQKKELRKEALELHRKLKGKIEIRPKMLLKTRKDLSLAYTPGVAEVALEISRKRDKAYEYTIKGNSVAVVTDGTAVLGLGNIGPEAALPIMEGKAMLFKEFAGIDAFPICLDTQDPDKIVEIVKNIAPVFGGINLEDISAPRCFAIEERLQDIGIPVMHDDQHGTAIVVLAGLINACKVVKKRFEDLKIVISGAGAAGTAISRLLICADYHGNICKSAADVVVCDTKGAIYSGRASLEPHKQMLAGITNRGKFQGSLEEALRDADVFVGVSGPNVLTQDMIRGMGRDPIIFAMANPVPEITPEKAKNAGARIVATGRSDYPNQVNNVLAFPGVFRGALDSRAGEINQIMKLSAAYALSRTVKKPEADVVLPSVFDKDVVKNIASAVKRAASI